MLLGSRLARERRTIKAMIALYCHDHHRTRGLCEQCRTLEAYADRRLDLCPYGAEKPTCVNCPVHCYQPRMRDAVRTVMRYACPRMLRRHPILAIVHVIDGRRPAPERPGQRRTATPLVGQRGPAAGGRP